jgi:phosphate transport system substrate-binding protein
MNHFRYMTLLLTAAVLGGTLLLAGCRSESGSQSTSTPQETIKVTGSDTMVNLGQALAEEFQKVNPNVSVAVSGGGSGVGITAFIHGEVEIAEASREMKASEIADAEKQGHKANQIVVAKDGIAVIVNPKNGVKELTEEQLAGIYTGKTTNWKAVGGSDAPIVVLNRETTSGTNAFFKEHIVQRVDKTAEYAKTARALPSSQAIFDEVSSNVNAIGYVGIGYVKPEVTALGVKLDAKSAAVTPSAATVLDKTYPIARDLYFYTDGEPTGAVKAYVDFVLGPKGQQVVAEQDFVPLPK